MIYFIPVIIVIGIIQLLLSSAGPFLYLFGWFISFALLWYLITLDVVVKVMSSSLLSKDFRGGAVVLNLPKGIICRLMMVLHSAHAVILSQHLSNKPSGEISGDNLDDVSAGTSRPELYTK